MDEASGDDDVGDQPIGGDQSFPDVIDSRFYLDRTSNWIWGTHRGHSVKELLSYSFPDAVSRSLEFRVNVVGGVVICSEPQTYPDLEFSMSGPWKVAAGVHPKHYREFPVVKGLALQQLLSHPKVVALGNMGLDRTFPADEWVPQEEVFVEMLRLARVDQPIVIHLRGVTGDRYGLDVTGACLLLMKEICKSQQNDHVHCFMGTARLKRVAEEIPKQLFWSHRRSPQLRPEALERTTCHPTSQIIVGV